MDLYDLSSNGWVNFVDLNQDVAIICFCLYANSIFGRCEEGNIVAIANTYEDMLNWYTSEAVEPWKDQIGDITYIKFFKPGSVLENYNPLHSTGLNEYDLFGHAIIRAQFYRNEIPSDVYVVPHVPSYS